MMDSCLELQYVANDGLSSRAIELFGGGGYSHVDIVWPDGRLFGARSDLITSGALTYPRGVQFRPTAYEKWRRVTRVQIPCTLAQKQRGLEWAMKQEGLPYDRLAILAFAFGRNWRTEDAWICSEMVHRFIEIAFGFETVILANKVTPGTSCAVASACRGMQLASE